MVAEQKGEEKKLLSQNSQVKILKQWLSLDQKKKKSVRGKFKRWVFNQIARNSLFILII